MMRLVLVLLPQLAVHQIRYNLVYIYKIVNLVNGKFYVGKTTRSITTRFNEHCRNPSEKMPITLAIEKYGKEKFKIEQLDNASSIEELNEKEKYYISSLSPEYNVSRGGEGGALFTGHSHSEETKKIIAQKMTGKKDSSETKLKKSLSRQSWKHSQETINKIANSCAKEYKFIDPTGNLITIKNLNKFCRENNLSSSNMRKVHCGKANFCKGYRRAC